MHSMNKQVFTFLLISLVALSGVGCSTMGKVFNVDTKMLLNFEVWPDVNPDSAGRASPVVVSIFELEDARQFSQEDFIHLYEDPKRYLGKDLIKRRRLKEFTPGYDRKTEFVVDPKTRFIGLLAEFSQYDKSQGRIVFEIKPHKKTKLNLRLSNLTIEQSDRKVNDDTEEEF
ncbi:MAG: type VI secretion system lipoprotein TssJ [Pseudomonadales bacterium]|nr:type VI secretion system lipoprotein TssJ [Pseudomonadales bacterium]